MIASVDRLKDSAGSPKQGRAVFRAVTFLAFAAVLAVLAFLAMDVGSAEASVLSSNSVESVRTLNYSIDSLGSTSQFSGQLPTRHKHQPAASGKGAHGDWPGMAVSEAGFDAAWIGRLTGGVATDGTNTIHGHSSNLSPQTGGLEPNPFPHQGNSLAIDNLAVLTVGGGMIQIVPELNRSLRDEGIFQAKSDEYAIRDSRVPGSRGNIHAWRPNTQPDWKEGETLQVAQWREFDTQSQDQEPFVGPEPVGTLPATEGADGTLNPGDTLQGEIETPGQFRRYKVVLEPGHRYLIDMKGEATGDGTLSDPWISGIKGAFATDDGVQMQPVWYDEQGRTSTEISWPNGEDFVLDQYGRFFEMVATSDGESVLRAPMGANDDGGEGFNARLFLVNFPAREYVLAVSGAPNPSPVGTFTISLTDVSEDDYSADPSGAGALEIGEPGSGEIEAPGDVDWFALDLTAGTDYEIRVRGLASGDISPGQPTVAAVLDALGVPQWDSQVEGQSNVVEFSPQADATYYVAVTSVAPYYPNSPGCLPVPMR